MMGNNKRINSGDPFLRLPEPLLERILYYLPCKDLGRTSTLSKTWKNLWITASPRLRFDENFFGEYDYDSSEGFSAKIKDLMDVVERTLCSRHDQKVISLEELVLRVPLYNNPSSREAAFYDQFISYALGCNVKKLSFINTSCGYNIPGTVFTLPTLTYLRLEECKLESLSCVSLPSLKTLNFLGVSADAKTIQNLIASCPAIEVLVLNKCHANRGALNISGLVNSKLVSATIRYCGFLGVEIEAPGLESFEIHGPCKISVSTCKRIKKLSVHDNKITGQWFHDHLSNLFLFEELEHLTLSNCYRLETITISSRRLKHLRLRWCPNLVSVDIDGSNLSTFKFAGSDVISLASKSRDLWKAVISILPRDVYPRWNVKLFEFLAKFNNSKLLTMSYANEEKIIVPRELRKSLPPPLYNVKHLVLHISRDLSSQAVKEVVDCLLWISPHPVTISISTFVEQKTWDLKFLYKEMDRDGNPCCCLSLPIKCWRRCIKEVRIKRSGGAGNEWYKDFFLNTRIFEED